MPTASINLSAPLTQAEREVMIDEFMRNQTTRAEKVLEKRKQKFISKLEGERGVRTEISVRKLRSELAKAAVRIDEKRACRQGSRTSKLG